MSSFVEIKLVCSYEVAKDQDYTPILEEKVSPVIATATSVKQQEFYTAVSKGYLPQMMLEIYIQEFKEAGVMQDGRLLFPQYVEKDGVRYKIIRGFELNADKMQLTCGEAD